MTFGELGSCTTVKGLEPRGNVVAVLVELTRTPDTS